MTHEAWVLKSVASGVGSGGSSGQLNIISRTKWSNVSSSQVHGEAAEQGSIQSTSGSVEVELSAVPEGGPEGISGDGISGGISGDGVEVGAMQKRTV